MACVVCAEGRQKLSTKMTDGDFTAGNLPRDCESISTINSLGGFGKETFLATIAGDPLHP